VAKSRHRRHSKRQLGWAQRQGLDRSLGDAAREAVDRHNPPPNPFAEPEAYRAYVEARRLRTLPGRGRTKKRPVDPKMGALLREALRRTRASDGKTHWYVHRTPPDGEWTLGHY